MGKVKKFLPLLIFIGINVAIISVVLILESESSSPKVVKDEDGNEYTLGVTEADSSAASLNIGEPAPLFTLTTFDGEIVKLSDLYEEKPVIIQFWATWCDICEREFPENNDYARNNKDKFHFVAVNWAESAGQVEAYIKRKDLDPTAIKFLMNESSDVIRAYRVRGTPTHVVVDKNGKIAFYNVGFTTSVQFESILDSL